LVLALHSGLALLGLCAGGALSALLTALALWSFRSDLRHGRQRLSRLLPSAPSLNVVGRLGAVEPARRVVLSAHIDSAQAGLLFSRVLADRFAALAGGRRRSGTPPPGPLVLPETLLIAATIVAVAGWMGAHGVLFGALRGIVEVGLALTAGVDAAMGVLVADARAPTTTPRRWRRCSPVPSGSHPSSRPTSKCGWSAPARKRSAAAVCMASSRATPIGRRTRPSS
jgi:hypothetical protein